MSALKFKIFTLKSYGLMVKLHLILNCKRGLIVGYTDGKGQKGYEKVVFKGLNLIDS